jgi:hypothetical protein
VCAPGTIQCTNGTLVCQQNQQASSEICNGLDDDCDGTVDEGAPCPIGMFCSAGQCIAP